MSSWSSGYVVDIDYTYGYYQELNPLRLAQAFLSAGIAWPEVRTACELGYGQGVSINIHAAASAAHWHGTDFNPAQAAFAQSLAAASGAPAALADQSFAEFAQRSDLPDFDFIGLHGIWSWISDENRHHIVDLVRRRLKPGGVLYISYNTLPGWTAMLPLQHLLQEHYARRPGEQGVLEGVDAALAFAESLLATDPRHARAHPQVARLLERVKAQDRHYVAHEYFNRPWHLTYFADLARSLEAAGLGFACSIHNSDLAGLVAQRRRACRIDDLDLSPALREITHDYILNRRFRRDIFVRGAEHLGPAERESRLKALGLLLLRPADLALSAVPTPYGAVPLDTALCRALLGAMDPLDAPVPLSELMARAGLEDGPCEPVFQTVAALVAHNTLGVVFPEDARQADPARARALNQVIARRAQGGDALRYLASPVTGQAVEAGAPERLCLNAWEAGARAPDDLAQALRQGGVPDPHAHAARFLQEVVPGWRRLGLLAAEAA